MIRRLLLAAAIAASGLGLATPASAADKLTVLLEWFVNPDHGPMVVAKELGLFEKNGLEVTLVPASDPTAPPRLIAAKQAEIAIHYQPNLYLDAAAGLPLVRFGTLVETPLNSLIVLANGPIKSVKDLKGKKVGFSVSGFEDVLLATMLRSVGLAKSDIQLVNVNFSLSPSLIAGQVDAIIGGFRNFELTQMKIEKHEGLAFFPEEHGVPPYEELIYVTHRDLVRDNRLPRFLDAVEQSTIFMTNHPDDAWKLFIKAYPDLNDALNLKAWNDTLPRFAKRPAALDRGRYERFGAFLVEQGLIKAAPPVDSIAAAIR